MIDLLSETLINFATACKEPALRNSKTGRPCHINQLYRYTQLGARALNGDRVRLEFLKTPSGMRTSREAVARFIAKLTNPDRPVPTAKVRSKQIAAAELELVEAGFEVGASV